MLRTDCSAVKMATLAHLSDVHLPAEPRIGLSDLNLKRGFGLINWRRKRRAIHRMAAADALVADMARYAPDHIAVTGDLVNLGLPEEHANALSWLQRLGTPASVSVVPGNHDIYTRLGADPGTARWQAYMASDDWGRTLTGGPGNFPYLRRVGDIALIGLCSAVPTPPFVAAGRLGADQLGRLPALLDATAGHGLVRVVLIHHPPFPGQAKRLRGLEDAAALQDIVARHGAELILHGHNHRNMEARTRWPGGDAVAIGVPSFSAALVHGHEPLARYNLITVTRDAAEMRIELVGRGLQSPEGPVIELERRQLHIRPAAAALQAPGEWAKIIKRVP
jgi:3',5'-cyclic AMP phosphodiesterase CpdA